MSGTSEDMRTVKDAARESLSLHDVASTHMASDGDRIWTTAIRKSAGGMQTVQTCSRRVGEPKWGPWEEIARFPEDAALVVNTGAVRRDKSRLLYVAVTNRKAAWTNVYSMKKSTQP